MKIPGHSHDREHYALGCWQFVSLHDGVPASSIERLASQSRHEFGFRKARGNARLFAGVQNTPSDSLARPIRMNEERANSRRVVSRVNFWTGLRAIVVAAADGETFAPAAAANNLCFVFDDEVGAIANELPIHRKDSSQSGFHLALGVVGRLKFSHRVGDQNFQRGDVGLASEPWLPVLPG